MSKSLLIIGAGGHGRVVADAASLSREWQKLAFVDDEYPELTGSGRWPVIGAIKDISTLVGNWSDGIVAIGDNLVRLDILEKIKFYGLNIPTIIHPSAQIAPGVVVGAGSVILSNVVVNVGSILGGAIILNTAATLDHDNKIGAGVHISPGAHLAGAVTVGPRSWIGIGATVVNNRVIGADTIIGAGAVVTKDIVNEVTAIGIPARVLDR